MTDKIVLADVASFQNDTSAVAVFNSNNDLITIALDNTLSRDGTIPNQMGSNLDMNNNQILNLPPPGSVNSPARLVDVTSSPLIASVPPTGTSGAVVPFLNGNNTWSGTNTYTSTSTFANAVVGGTLNVTGTATFLANPSFPANSTSFSEIAQGSGLSVLGVAGNATANLASIVGTSDQVLSVNEAGTALAFAQPQGDQLLGTTTNDNAVAGNVGEFISSSIALGSAVSLTTATPANVTSISLTAGDWDVNTDVYFTGGVGAAVTYLAGSVSTTSATMDTTTLGRFASVYCAGGSAFATANSVSNIQAVSLASTRVSVASTTTVYAVAQSVFTSTCSAYGIIRARRIR